MSGSKARVNPAIEVGGVGEVQRPERLNPTKGKTSYPFDDVEVGQHFFVARTPGSVRSALLRWQEMRKDSKKRFEMWRHGDGRVVVKRVK